MVVCPREATGATNHHFLGLHARIVPWKILLSTRWMPSQPPIPTPSALQLPWGYRDVITWIRYGSLPEGSHWGGESSILCNCTCSCCTDFRKILLSTRWMPSQPPIPTPSALQLPWGYRDVIIPIRFGGWPEGSYWGGESSIFGIAPPVAPIVPWIFLRSTRWMPRHLPIFTPSALQLPWVNNDVMIPIRYGSLPGERIQRGRPAVSCASAVLLSESPRSL